MAQNEQVEETFDLLYSLIREKHRQLLNDGKLQEANQLSLKRASAEKVESYINRNLL